LLIYYAILLRPFSFVSDRNAPIPIATECAVGAAESRYAKESFLQSVGVLNTSWDDDASWFEHEDDKVYSPEEKRVRISSTTDFVIDALDDNGVINDSMAASSSSKKRKRLEKKTKGGKDKKEKEPIENKIRFFRVPSLSVWQTNNLHHGKQNNEISHDMCVILINLRGTCREPFEEPLSFNDGVTSCESCI
jgi:hypothetical protein